MMRIRATLRRSSDTIAVGSQDDGARQAPGAVGIQPTRNRNGDGAALRLDQLRQRV